MEIERSDREYMYARINGRGKCAPITRARDSGRKKDERISRKLKAVKSTNRV